MSRHSIIEVKKPQPLKGHKLEHFLGLLQQIMELCDDSAAECERLDGKFEVKVIPTGEGDMRVIYNTSTRWCCTCSPSESDSGECGSCMKSSRELGAIRNSPGCQGTVESFRFSPPRARLSKVKKKVRAK